MLHSKTQVTGDKENPEKRPLFTWIGTNLIDGKISA